MGRRKKQDIPREELPVALSLSGGASSEWLLRKIMNGELPRPKNVAGFFADTGGEHVWTYERIDRIEEDCRAAGIPFFRCHHPRENLSQQLLSLPDGTRTRADQPPIWIRKHGGGIARAEHRCTREFKVAPMRRAVSGWLKSLGLPKRVRKWIGFGADEQGRAMKAVARQLRDVRWEELEFPAIELGAGREQQRADVVRLAGSVPPFSMCVYCPFKDPARWMATPEVNRPLAIAADEAVRDLDQLGLTEGEGFMSSQIIPVSRLLREGAKQPSLPGLDSYCDGGHCFL